jgi:tRNA threonylcarbamoyladenosine biosynthesis protein TsaE
VQRFTFISASPEATETLGRRLGEIIVPPALLLLRGDLGAGKTCFVRGLARGLGVPVDEPVTSPTYALMHHYQGRHDLYHFDLYRLSGWADLVEIGFDEYVEAGKIAVVEWSERADGAGLEGLEITFTLQDEDTRVIEIAATAEQDVELLLRLDQCIGRKPPALSALPPQHHKKTF